ncbi:MAG TPA: OsmC family protein [Candidatus Limnocylindrales bacterium]
MPITSFQPLVEATRVALAAGAPTAGLRTFRVESRQEAGLRSRVRIRSFDVGVDEPPTLGGTDTAPNPVEYALAALATCQEITYRLHADHLGIPLDSVAVTLEGDIDLRGFFGVDDAVRPGFSAIRGEVTLDSPASPEDIERLRVHVDAHCPVLDLLTTATPLTLSVATVTKAVA